MRVAAKHRSAGKIFLICSKGFSIFCKSKKLTVITIFNKFRCGKPLINLLFLFVLFVKDYSKLKEKDYYYRNRKKEFMESRKVEMENVLVQNKIPRIDLKITKTRIEMNLNRIMY